MEATRLSETLVSNYHIVRRDNLQHKALHFIYFSNMNIFQCVSKKLFSYYRVNVKLTCLDVELDEVVLRNMCLK